MTLSEISSYELAYQIRTYLSSHEMTQEAFADLTDFPAPLLSRFLRDGGPELSVSQMVRICNVLSISMDSLVHGPVQDKRFEQLIRKCIFANKLKGTKIHEPLGITVQAVKFDFPFLPPFEITNVWGI